MSTPVMRKLTPVFVLDDIAPTRDYLVDRLGFELAMQIGADPAAEIGAGNPPGFAMLTEGSVEVMLQSRESVRRDSGKAMEGELSTRGVAMFIEVSDLGRVREVAAAPEPGEVSLAERETFYGMREIGLRLPGNITMVFAQRVDGRDC